MKNHWITVLKFCYNFLKLFRYRQWLQPWVFHDILFDFVKKLVLKLGEVTEVNRAILSTLKIIGSDLDWIMGNEKFRNIWYESASQCNVSATSNNHNFVVCKFVQGEQQPLLYMYLYAKSTRYIAFYRLPRAMPTGCCKHATLAACLLDVGTGIWIVSAYE